MKRVIPVLAVLAAPLAQALAGHPGASLERPFRYQPEPAFEDMVKDVVTAFAPKDALAELADCRAADAKTIAPVTLEQAVQMLKPCAEALSLAYETPVEVKEDVLSSGDGLGIQIQGLVFALRSAPVGSAALRDLSHALTKRNGLILGHPALVRQEKNEAPAASAAQGALDRCPALTVVRNIKSSEDFIKHYGACLMREPAFRIQEMRPWAGHEFSVALLTKADRRTVESLSGSVVVNSGSGPVLVRLIAYPETVYLP